MHASNWLWRARANDEYGETGARQAQSEQDIPMSSTSETWQLGSQTLQVSHMEKPYWPQTGFTKGDLLRYYRQIAPVALPHFKDRPVTLRVFPWGSLAYRTTCATVRKLLSRGSGGENTIPRRSRTRFICP